MAMTEEAVRVAFGLFEADLATGELWKAGRKVKLQTQPFKVLAVLLEKPGAVVSREDLQTRLWGKNAVGDFEHSLGTAINKIRDALGDTADNPRFVETLARRGYRFIAPVSIVSIRESVSVIHATEIAAREPDKTAESPSTINAGSPPHPLPIQAESAAIDAAPPAPLHPSPQRRPPLSPSAWFIACLVVVAALAIATAIHFAGRREPPLLRINQLTHTGRIAPGMPAMESLPASATDGLRIFVPTLEDGRSVLSEVDVHTGAALPLSVPREIPSPMLGDLSPDGSTLLLRSHLSPESEQPFWLVPARGGSALRLANVVGHDATWMPDGKNVLYATGNQLVVNRLEDGANTPFATLPGRAFWMRWSPDGQLLRFTLMDPIGHTLGLWQADRNGKQVRRILEGWTRPSSECCGIWTGDGRFFVFQSNRAENGASGGTSDLWRLNEKSDSGPVRVTDGPLNFVAPLSPRIGSKLFFLGLESLSVLQQFDLQARQFKPAQPFLANASRIEYTRDHARVTWTDLDGRQWRAHADGSEVIQITPDSLQVFSGHWSPDGQRLALMAREPGKAWQIYTVSAAGGALEHLMPQGRNLADPSWSSDGQQIVFGRVSDVMGKEEGPRALEILDLRTHTVASVPGSDGLFSPRWSPDGRYIAALSLDQRRLVLFDTITRQWRTLAETSAADPVWAANSKAIYFHASLADTQPIYRVSIPDARLEPIASLASFPGGATADYFFCGLTPTDVPIVRSRTGTANLYTIDLEESAP